MESRENNTHLHSYKGFLILSIHNTKYKRKTLKIQVQEFLKYNYKNQVIRSLYKIIKR